MKYFFEQPELYSQPEPVDDSYQAEYGLDDTPLPIDYSAYQPEGFSTAEADDFSAQEDDEDYVYDPTDDDAFINQMVNRGYSRPRSDESVYGGSSRPSFGAAQASRGAGSISPQEAYRYYTEQHGLPAHVAAGIIGNLQQESSLDPHAIGDNGTSKGLAQWHNERWTGLQNHAKRTGRDVNDPYFQLDYILQEPGESARMLQRVGSAKSPEEAALQFGRTYERYNPKSANESGRQQYARAVHGTPQGQFGLDLLASVGTQVGGQLIGGILENIFNPEAQYQSGVESTLNQLQGQEAKRNQALRQAQLQAQQQDNQTPRYGQQGGSTFAELKAFKPIQVGMNQPLSAAGSTAYKTDQMNKFGFEYQPDSPWKPGIMNYMKQEGHNVTGQAYTNDAPLQAAMADPLTTQPKPINLQGAGNWISKLLNGSGISLATQAVAGLAAQQESAQIRKSEWEKLADQPYQKIRTNRGISGAGLPAYARYGAALQPPKYYFDEY